MKTVNELIVALVTGSNEASRLAPEDVATMLRLAATMVRHLEDPAHPGGGSSAAEPLDRQAETAAGMEPEAWQAALRAAAEQLRRLQPEVDTDRAIPTHAPDGGDGGNY